MWKRVYSNLAEFINNLVRKPVLLAVLLANGSTETKNASMTRCSPSPPRNQQSKVLVGGLLPGGIALLFFLARVAALIPKTSRKPAWDDWTMCLMVAFTIPPTIFTINRTFSVVRFTGTHR